MDTGSFFSREGPIVDFPGVGQKYFCRVARSGKITFPPLETKTTTFFAKYLMGKRQISKSWGALAPLSDAHAHKTSYNKKAEEDNKNIFTNKRMMIFENHIY